MSSQAPVLSVIVPAHGAEAFLPDTLGALLRSDFARENWELIVVDDASPDRTASVAEEYADTVLRLSGGPKGPSFARNRGVEVSRGSILVFVDADVRIHPTALRQFAERFEEQPDLGAIFGSYDDAPEASGVVSQYRNLLHHYHHHQGAGEAGTFWAGLGAVRAHVFDGVGRYDEQQYERPRIEDIELGRRMVRAGHRILLDPTIQGTHLKQWTMRDLVLGDLVNRGIPWMVLILREGAGGNQLNVGPRERICVALVGIVCLTAVAALALGRWELLALVPVVLAVVWAMNLELYRFLYSGRGVGFLVGALPLHFLYYVVSGVSAVLGYAAYRLDRRPRPSPEPR